MAKTLRQPRLSVFAFVEGDNERVFMEHLKRLYCSGRTIYVPVQVAHGKGPAYIIDKACRVRAAASYFNHSFILLDTDITWPPASVKKAKKMDFELIGNTPCIESLFLHILEPGIDHSLKVSSACKREFNSKHMSHAGSFSAKDCEKLFPKHVLDGSLSRISHLNRIVEILTGNY